MRSFPVKLTLHLGNLTGNGLTVHSRRHQHNPVPELDRVNQERVRGCE